MRRVRRAGLPLCWVVAWLAPMAGAGLQESFDSPHLGQSYIRPAQFHDLASGAWYAFEVLGETGNNARGATGRAVRMNRDVPHASLATPMLPQGAGTLTFWLRAFGADSGVLSVQVSVFDHADGFKELARIPYAETEYIEHEIAVNREGPVWLRFVNDNQPARAVLDDVRITALPSSGDDPNIVVGDTIDFGRIEPGGARTRSLAIRNGGVQQALEVEIIPLEGDAESFTIEPLPNNGVIAPGQAVLIDVTYAPGSTPGVEHEAVYAIASNDENPDDRVRPLRLRGGVYPEVDIYDIQFTTDPGGDSPLLGRVVMLRGVVTMLDADGYVLADPQPGPWRAVRVHDRDFPARLGELRRIRGEVAEHFNMTQIVNVANSRLLAVDQPLPVIRGLSPRQAADEAHESCLVTLTDLEVLEPNLGFGEFLIGNEDESLRVDSLNDYAFMPLAGKRIHEVTGVVWYSFGNFKLQPRDDDDFAYDARVYTLKGDVVGEHGLLQDHYVTVRGHRIARVAAAPPQDGLIVDTQAYIFPGLINAHDHPTYNVLRPIAFPNQPGEFPFRHRDEWRTQSATYRAWQDKTGPVRAGSHAEIVKIAEVRELIAGCTLIQNCGVCDDAYGHPHVGIRNLERGAARIHEDTFPLPVGGQLANRVRNGYYERVLVHLAEGVDQKARDEFHAWREAGVLDHTTVVIHGTAFGLPEWEIMAEVGAKLVWSPKSNMALYGVTTRVDQAKAHGIQIALAPDWTPSGEANTLDELYYAYQLNQDMFDNAFTNAELVGMVSWGAARVLGLDDRLGHVRQGYLADLAVVEKRSADPYLSLIYSGPQHVRLTVVHGDPRYGDDALFEALGITDNLEEVVVCSGVRKSLRLAVNHPHVPQGEQTFAQVYQAMLEKAEQHDALDEILPIEACSSREAVPSLTPFFTMTARPDPTPDPTATQTETPFETPSFTPTFTPSFTPSMTPSMTPSITPTNTSTQTATYTATFTFTPTFTHSMTPSNTPTFTATPTPSATAHEVHAASADFNNDGVVDHLDLLRFIQEWRARK